MLRHHGIEEVDSELLGWRDATTTATTILLCEELADVLPHRRDSFVLEGLARSEVFGEMGQKGSPFRGSRGDEVDGDRDIDLVACHQVAV